MRKKVRRMKLDSCPKCVSPSPPRLSLSLSHSHTHTHSLFLSLAHTLSPSPFSFPLFFFFCGSISLQSLRQKNTKYNERPTSLSPTSLPSVYTDPVSKQSRGSGDSMVLGSIPATTNSIDMRICSLSECSLSIGQQDI